MSVNDLPNMTVQELKDFCVELILDNGPDTEDCEFIQNSKLRGISNLCEVYIRFNDEDVFNQLKDIAVSMSVNLVK